MNPDEHPTPREFVRSRDSPGGVTTYTYFVTAPPFSFEHDREKGIYRLTWSDGRVEVFRDKPVALPRRRSRRRVWRAEAGAHCAASQRTSTSAAKSGRCGDAGRRGCRGG